MENNQASWDIRYSGPTFVYGTKPCDSLVEHAALFTPGSRGLCLGDGEGRNSVWLAQRGIRMDAVDFSEKALDKMKRLAAVRGVVVHGICADIRHWECISGEYDFATSFYLCLEARERSKLYEKLTEVIKPGGLVLLESFAEQASAPFSCSYGAGELLAAFSSFRILRLEEQIQHLDHGPLHQGEATILTMLAQKSAH